MNRTTFFQLLLYPMAFLLLLREVTNEPVMVFPGREWEEQPPKKQGLEPEKLDAAMKYLESHCGPAGTTEMAVIRNGYLIWKGDSIDKVHSTWSVGKVFTSTLLGLLTEKGLCQIDETAADYEPLLKSGYPDATLRHFATMTAGYDAKGGGRGSARSDFGDWSESPYHPDLPMFAPGEAYLYWDEAMMMLGRILTKIAGEDLYLLFKRRIADEIGIGNWEWEQEGDLNGIPVRNGAGMVWISARDLARFGHLVLNNGFWKRKKLIGREWLSKATSVQVPASLPLFRDINPDPERKNKLWDVEEEHMNVNGSGLYGFHWWVNGITPEGNRHLPDAPEGTFYRSGYPHNMLFIVPEWNMVIVRLGDEYDGRPKMERMAIWNNTLKLIKASFLK